MHKISRKLFSPKHGGQKGMLFQVCWPVAHSGQHVPALSNLSGSRSPQAALLSDPIWVPTIGVPRSTWGLSFVSHHFWASLMEFSVNSLLPRGKAKSCLGFKITQSSTKHLPPCSITCVIAMRRGRSRWPCAEWEMARGCLGQTALPMTLQYNILKVNLKLLQPPRQQRKRSTGVI